MLVDYVSHILVSNQSEVKFCVDSPEIPEKKISEISQIFLSTINSSI